MTLRPSRSTHTQDGGQICRRPDRQNAAGPDTRLSRVHIRAELGRAVAGNRHAQSPRSARSVALISTPICLALSGGSQVPRIGRRCRAGARDQRGDHCLAILDYRG